MLLEHRQIERFHGREKLDHPDTEGMLKTLPESLWSLGPTDVGFCSTIPPVSFDLLDAQTPIWQNRWHSVVRYWTTLCHSSWMFLKNSTQ